MQLPCPVCGGSVEVPDDAIPGEILEHEECGIQLEFYIDENNNPRLRVLDSIVEDWGE